MEKKKVLHQPTIVFQEKTKEFKKCFHTKEARIEETKVRTHKKQSNNFLLGGKWFFKYYKEKGPLQMWPKCVILSPALWSPIWWADDSKYTPNFLSTPTIVNK